MTQTVVIVFIVGRHFDSNESIDTVKFKNFSKIPCESIELIETVDLVFKVGSNELTGIFKRYFDLNKLIYTVDLKYCPKIQFGSIKSIKSIHTIDLKYCPTIKFG